MVDPGLRALLSRTLHHSLEQMLFSEMWFVTGIPSSSRRNRTIPSIECKREPGQALIPSTPPSVWNLDSTYLFLLLVEVVNDDTNEKVQGEEGTEDDEDDKVDVHVEVVLPLRLFFIL